GRLEDKVNQDADGKPAGDFAAGLPSHAVGHKHPVGGFAGVTWDLAGRQVGQQRLHAPVEAGDQKMVLVIWPDLAWVGQRPQIYPNECRIAFGTPNVRNLRPGEHVGVYIAFSVHRFLRFYPPDRAGLNYERVGLLPWDDPTAQKAPSSSTDSCSANIERTDARIPQINSRPERRLEE